MPTKCSTYKFKINNTEYIEALARYVGELAIDHIDIQLPIDVTDKRCKDLPNLLKDLQANPIYANQIVTLTTKPHSVFTSMKGLLPHIKLNSDTIKRATRLYLAPAVITLNNYINFRTFAHQPTPSTYHLMPLTRKSAWMALALAYEKTPFLSAFDLPSEGAILCETMDGQQFLLSYLNKKISERSIVFDIDDGFIDLNGIDEPPQELQKAFLQLRDKKFQGPFLQLPQDESIRSFIHPTPPSFFQRTNQWMQDHFSFVNGIFSAATNYLQGKGIAFSLVQGIISTLLMEIFTRSRRYYLDSAAQYYDSVEKLSMVINKNERLALQAGEQAKTWSGYLKSYGNYRTYIHPRVFAGGLKFGKENNHEISYCIRRLR